MNFLAPLFLAGAAAVALPFVFHLIRRSSRERVLFSSLMFLEPSPPRITKRSRLEHLLLLLCRCAVLCLLAFAFARPFFPKPMHPAANAGESTLVAILVDSSASMRRENLWAQAKEQALSVARGLHPGDRLAIYTFDRQLHRILGFDESASLKGAERVQVAERRLGAASPSWFGTQLGRPMLAAAEELIDRVNHDSREQGNTDLRLIVVSDFQSGARLDGLQGFEWPKRLQVEVLPVQAKDFSNAGVQVLEQTRRSFSEATNQPVRLRVSNDKTSKIEQFTIQWRRGNESVGPKERLYVPAGQSRVTPAPARPDGADSIALGGDSIDFDNFAYVARTVTPPVPIIYFGSDAPDDPHGLAYYLRRAFEQTNLSTRFVAMSNTVPADATSAALLIVGQAMTPPAVTLARDLLRSGKTVFLPLRDASEVAAVRELTGANSVRADEAPETSYRLFGHIDFNNPLFAPFADARFSDFTKIHFWKHRTLDVNGLTNAVVLAAFDSGAPLLVQIPVERGRLLVMATTWIPTDSQFALSSKFVPLLFGILEQSAGLRNLGHQFAAGENVPLPKSGGDILLPDGSRKPVTNDFFAEANAPGIYRAGDFQFAVNVDPSESRITPLTPEDLSSLGVPIHHTVTAADAAATAERQRHLLATESESRQKLWRNFIIAALAFVFLETYLSGRLSRQPVAQ